MKLLSLDLFSGIGGLSLALDDIVKPLAYCDIHEGAQKVLENNIKAGKLWKAPICDDVKKLGPEWLAQFTRKVPNTIVAGFPCVGFSSIGSKQGFKNEQSALFFELLRVCDVFHIDVMFLENVPGVLNMGFDTIVKELAKKRGFTLKWCLVSACDIGAPHRRKRWYCIAYRNGMDAHLPKQIGESLLARRIWKKKEPVRMILERGQWDEMRHFLLGNSVVPQAAQHAYNTLLRSGAWQEKTTSYPPCGMATPNGKIWQLDVDIKKTQRRALNLTLVPGAFVSAKPPAKSLKRSLVKDEVHLEYWGTPTSNTLRPSNYLTERSKIPLHTQVRFERGTPDHLRGGRVNPVFVEWMMGYPSNWTKI